MPLQPAVEERQLEPFSHTFSASHCIGQLIDISAISWLNIFTAFRDIELKAIGFIY